MKIIRYLSLIAGLCIAATQAFGAATILPPPETCFQALTPTSGGPNGTGTGFVGLTTVTTSGTGGTSGSYGGIPLSGGTGSGATANIVVSGGGVTSVSILNPGLGYSVSDSLTTSPTNIGGTSGFVLSVSSVAINTSLVGGSVYTYVPSTATLKTTWFNTDQAAIHQNTNPVQLDANGCAIIIGTGGYRFVVQDSLGNTVYDQTTADTSSSNSTFWAGLAGGTPNAITVTDAGFNSTDGSVINFIPVSTNTGATTLSPSELGPYPIVKDTTTGAVALVGGEIVANNPSNIVSVIFSASQQNFHILNLVQSSTSTTAAGSTPGGYLNLLGISSGGPYQSTDVTAATTIYYDAVGGGTVPIWNGSSFAQFSFTELQLALSSSSQTANNIYDICAFSNSGVVTLAFGPAWSNATTGAGSRGTGAGTAQLTYEQGVLVNANQITANNGSNSYTVPGLRCTYLGSALIDSTNGQISNYVTGGQSRKWGLWNAYHQQTVRLQVWDSTVSWLYTSEQVAPRPSNNNTANELFTFAGIADQSYTCSFSQSLNPAAGGATGNIGIGWNSTTSPYAFSGTVGTFGVAVGDVPASATVGALYYAAPSIGLNTASAFEQSNTTAGTAFAGTQKFMVLSCAYPG